MKNYDNERIQKSRKLKRNQSNGKENRNKLK